MIHTQKYDIVRMVCLTIAMMEKGGRSVKRKVFCALLALCVLISTVGWSALPALAETDETGGFCRSAAGGFPGDFTGG